MPLFTLDKMPRARYSEFKRMVENSQGKLTLLVHPYFSRNARERYYRVLDKIIEKQRTPIVMMVDCNAIAENPEFYERLNNGRILVVPTVQSDPALILGYSVYRGERVIGFSSKDIPTDMSLEVLIKYLKNFGVGKIFLGGMYFRHEVPRPKVKIHEEKEFQRITRNNQDEMPRIEGYSGGCLGYTYYRLIKADAFRVILLPAVSHPSVPEHLHILRQERQGNGKKPEKGLPKAARVK